MTVGSIAERFFHLHVIYEDYWFFAVTALCFYDYFLTLDREIHFIWKTKISFSIILFYCYRYAALSNLIFELLERDIWWRWLTAERCSIIIRFQMSLFILELASSAFFATLRVYAVSDRKRWLAIAVLLTGLTNPAISAYYFAMSPPIVFTFERWQSCNLGVAGSMYTEETMIMVARGASLLSDGLVLAATCMKTFRKDWNTSSDIAERYRSGVKGILLRDTVLCFALLCLLNVVTIATGRITDYIVIWMVCTAVLQSVLLSRLSLDLREAAVAESMAEELTSPTLRFGTEQEESLDDSDVSLGTYVSSYLLRSVSRENHV